LAGLLCSKRRFFTRAPELLRRTRRGRSYLQSLSRCEKALYPGDLRRAWLLPSTQRHCEQAEIEACPFGHALSFRDAQRPFAALAPGAPHKSLFHRRGVSTRRSVLCLSIIRRCRMLTLPLSSLHFFQHRTDFAGRGGETWLFQRFRNFKKVEQGGKQQRGLWRRSIHLSAQARQQSPAHSRAFVSKFRKKKEWQASRNARVHEHEKISAKDKSTQRATLLLASPENRQTTSRSKTLHGQPIIP